jgi:secreted trypsin-like serine protease
MQARYRYCRSYSIEGQSSHGRANIEARPRADGRRAPFTGIIAVIFVVGCGAEPVTVGVEVVEDVAAFDEQTDRSALPIIGGSNAPLGAYLWMASLRSAGDGHFCGGSLVAPRWVLTAAHCVDPDKLDEFGIVLSSVVVGGYDRTNPTDGERFNVVGVPSIHPQYGYVLGAGNIQYPVNDIALIQLDRDANNLPVALNDDPKFPVFVEFANANAAADNSTVIGWGSNGQTFPAILQEVQLPILSDSSCAAALPFTPLSSNICAGHTNGGQDSCNGDSGGPLISYVANQPMLVGVVSTGPEPCAQAPGVYARVSSFDSWIRETIGVPAVVKSDLTVASRASRIVSASRVSNAIRTEQAIYTANTSLVVFDRPFYTNPWVGTSMSWNLRGPPAVINGSPVDFGVPTQHIFARRLDGSPTGDLMHSWRGNAGWAHENLTSMTGTSHRFIGDPVVINGPENGNNNVESMHVFGQGNGASARLIHYQWLNFAGWSAEDVSAIVGAPASQRPAGRISVIAGGEPANATQRTLHIYARGPNNNLVHYYRIGTTWAVEDLTALLGASGLPISTDPVAQNSHSSGNNRVRTQDVFAFNSAGNLIHYYWINYAGWAAENLTLVTGAGSAGNGLGAPSVIKGPERSADGTLFTHVFLRNGSGKLVQYVWSKSTGWSFQNVSGSSGLAIAGDPVAVNGTSMLGSGSSDQHVFAVGTGNTLVHYFRLGSWSWENLTPAGSTYSVYSPLSAQLGPFRGNTGVRSMSVLSQQTGQLARAYGWINWGGWARTTLSF